MPKSASAIQNQIDGCERSMTEGLANCASLAGDNNFQFSFSLKGFVDGISACDVEETQEAIQKVRGLLAECDKILTTEKKRRLYTKQLRKNVALREQKETIKRLTMKHAFKKRAQPLKIPSLTSSQEPDREEDELD